MSRGYLFIRCFIPAMKLPQGRAGMQAKFALLSPCVSPVWLVTAASLLRGCGPHPARSPTSPTNVLGACSTTCPALGFPGGMSQEEEAAANGSDGAKCSLPRCLLCEVALLEACGFPRSCWALGAGAACRAALRGCGVQGEGDWQGAAGGCW